MTMLAFLLATSFASAEGSLPGVQRPKSIVTAPPPEPEPDNTPQSLKRFRVGNTDVTISGSITVDAGSSGQRGR